MEPRPEWELDIDEDALPLRRYYEDSLHAFAEYINPLYMYGEAHYELFSILERTESDDEDVARAAAYQLVLYPRGHLKSHCMAVWVVWKVTKEPWTTVIYLTAGEDLATVQMKAIKDMFTCEEYVTLWPEMFAENEADREKWSTWSIITDHPVYKERRVRDYTVIIKTIGSSATGLHCDALVLDDVVTKNNAYTDAGRKLVEDTVADFAAVKNTGAITKAAGTRYDEKDIYGKMIDAETPILNMETGEQIGSDKQWQVFNRQVESRGDGLGTYLWPRVQSPTTGQWFGFDFNVLIQKKTEFVSIGTLAQYYAQYYNDPNMVKAGDHAGFHYYSRKGLQRVGETWYYGDKRLEIAAGMDLAWTDETGKNGKRADYTAIVIIGVDSDGFIYVLDAVQFKTSKYSVYYRHIAKAYDMWRFRKLHVESESAGKFIVEALQNLVRENALNLVVVGKTVPRNQSKEERAAAILEPRYDGSTILHYKGGIISELELQITSLRPRHDDLRDALTIAVDNAKKGVVRPRVTAAVAQNNNTHMGASRFGGRRR
jgi:predicted phage terminase large subunit-like protein